MAKFLGTGDNLLKTSPEQHIALRRKERGQSTEILQFPSNLGAHATLMRFFEYTYGGAKGAVETPVAEVLLPLPKQIQDSFKINVQGDEIGVIATGAAGVASGNTSIGGAAADIASAVTGGIRGFGSALGDAVTGDLSALKSGAGKVGDAAGFLTAIGAAKIAPDIANAVGAGRGTAVNPFATLVFKGVDLKVHSLEWLLSPETEQESRDLKAIIRTLQRMVLPKTDSAIGGAETEITAINKGLLRYPAMVNIFFQGLDQNYFFKFKTSMISQLNIDYSPNGLAIQKGGKPSAVRITMTLNEAYIHTSADNEAGDLSAEAVDERLFGDISNESLSSIQQAQEPSYSAEEDFSNLQSNDEIIVAKTLPDGTITESVVPRSVLNNDGITNDMIAAGGIPGDDTVAFAPLPVGMAGSRI